MLTDDAKRLFRQRRESAQKRGEAHARAARRGRTMAKFLALSSFALCQLVAVLVGANMANNTLSAALSFVAGVLSATISVTKPGVHAGRDAEAALAYSALVRDLENLEPYVGDPSVPGDYIRKVLASVSERMDEIQRLAMHIPYAPSIDGIPPVATLGVAEGVSWVADLDSFVEGGGIFVDDAAGNELTA